MACLLFDLAADGNVRPGAATGAAIRHFREGEGVTIALAVCKDHLASVLTAADALVLFERERRVQRGRHRIRGFGVNDAATQISDLEKLGVKVLLCGAVAEDTRRILEMAGIRVIPFLRGSIGEVMDAFCTGRLVDPGFRQPGCRGRFYGQGRYCRRRYPGPSGPVGSSKEERTMKVAITAEGPDLTAPFDIRFGRAKWFLVIEEETGVMAAHTNRQNLDAPQGAGIQAATAISQLGVKVLITGNVGPNAFRTLQAAGIRIVRVEGDKVKTAAEALEAWKRGEVGEVRDATVRGHWM